VDVNTGKREWVSDLRISSVCFRGEGWFECGEKGNVKWKGM